MSKFVLEGKLPCVDWWDQLRPPEWWTDESGTHDGLWEADAPEDVVRAFRNAYPSRHQKAKPYPEFRVTAKPSERRFKVVELSDELIVRNP